MSSAHFAVGVADGPTPRKPHANRQNSGSGSRAAWVPYAGTAAVTTRRSCGCRVAATLIRYAVGLAVVLPLLFAIARACSSAVATTTFSMSANRTSASVVIA